MSEETNKPQEQNSDSSENVTDINYQQINIQETNFPEIKTLQKAVGMLFLITLVGLGVLGYSLNKTTEKLTFYESFLNPGVDKLPEINKATEHIRGNKNAKVALVEYSDYDCPFCQKFHLDAKKALEESNGEVMWVYRHFPIASLHPEAQKKSEASECVYEQGGDEKFWEFTDELYSSRPPLTELPALVERMGLNKDEFVTCLDSGKYAQKVVSDLESGAAAGVSGTPGNFIINLETDWKRVKLRGAVSAEEVLEYIKLVK